MRRRATIPRDGFVLLAVLFVLLALFALSAPFLATARNADAASQHASDRVQLGLALDGAARRGRSGLQATHPAIDETPYYDGLDELDVDVMASEGYPDPHDANGVAWDAEAVDLSARIDLGSASPQVLANLLSRVARLSFPMQAGDAALRVNRPDRFDEGGVLIVDGELIKVGGLDDERNLTTSNRGIGASQDDEGKWSTTGPSPPRGHGVGAYVFDQRTFAPAIWRTLSVDGAPQVFDAVEEIRASADFSMSGGFTESDLRALRRTTQTAASAAVGPRWQRPTRLASPMRAGESFSMYVVQGRWMAPGSTVRITDGVNTELRVVIQRGQDGRVFLDRVLDNDYAAFESEVSVLVRRPVNVNSASADVLTALFANLGLAGQNHRISGSEASELAALCVESRPFTGFKDFLERLVLPAGGIDALPQDGQVPADSLGSGGSILDDPRDSVALYINALNANDARLAFSTMPLCFTTDGLFELELRAAVNGSSGYERTSGVRTDTMIVAPARGDLFQLFTRQEDFDRALRLDRGAPYWLTGPQPTGRYDGGVQPPSRTIPHLGTIRGQRYIPGIDEPVLDADGNPVPADRVFAGQSSQDFCQLDPVRLGATQRTQGRIFHFDQESRSLEGRFLPDQAIVRDPTDGVVRWADPTAGVAQPLSISMWVRPETAGDGTLASLGSAGPDSDRVVLGMTGGNLVARVFDGMGDHRDTAFQEVAEVRFPMAPAQGVPGLPVNTWSHVSLDVRGNRPDQINLLVNGNSTGVETLGMTSLTAGVGSGTSTIPVESTEGFPDPCVLRIGSELIEATVAGPRTFQALHQTSGGNAGFGGRLARVRFDVEGSDEAVPLAGAAAGITGSYQPGTPVVHYGYSLPLVEGVPAGGAQLPGDLGPFRVARVLGRPNDNSLEPIQTTNGAFIIQLGRGWSSTQLGELELQLADNPEADPAGQEVMPAFNPNGGYALLSGPGGVTVQGQQLNNPTGDVVGGAEIIRYSGYSGNRLTVVERGVELQSLQGLDPTSRLGGARAFVFDWDLLWALGGGQTVDPDTYLPASCFVTPISIPAPGASALNFGLPEQGVSQFAQITRTDDPDKTEWVRYDELDLTASQLVRAAPDALLSVHRVLHDGADGGDTNNPNGPGNPGGPGGGGGFGGGGVGGGAPGTGGTPGGSFVDGGQPRRRGAALLAQQAGADWDPFRGVEPNTDFPLSRAVASVLHHRGVLGTRSGDHPSGVQILPVVRINAQDLDANVGRPGAFDPVWVVDGNPTALGYPVTVHRAHYPAFLRRRFTWTAPIDGRLVAGEGNPVDEPQGGFFTAGAGYVAFQAPVVAPTAPGVGGGGGGASNITDPRFRGRIVKFPSGEMPRGVSAATVGTGAGGAVDFGVPQATVDEVVFDNATVFQGIGGTAPPSHLAGGALLVGGGFGETAVTFTVLPNTARAANGTYGNPAPILGQLPQDGGLLRVGEELIAYRSLDQATGNVTVAAGGRGMLGTRPQPHQVTEPVTLLEGWRVTTLSGGVGPFDASIPVASTANFPAEGTLLIDQELVHYTTQFGGAFVMPRASAESGEEDDQGEGAFRGRYGTTPQSHPAGAAVVSFPARYWDRYAPRFDGPELAYFGLSIEQIGAYWTGVTWEAQDSNSGGAEIVVLQRIGDVPWDADPEEEPGLRLLEDGTFEDDLIPLGAQADRIQWRVFARYAPGAFDPEFGLSHGWKGTPRFIHLGATYEAPTRLIRSVRR